MEKKIRTTVLKCEGHPNIRATHSKTFELVREDTVTQSGTCIVGVKCEYDEDALLALRGVVRISLKCGDIEDHISARINPTFRRGDPLIFRRNDKPQPRTFCLSASKGASLLNKDLISALQKPGAQLEITVSEALTDESSDGALYVVGMPIGNMSDLSLRALDVLQSVDVVLAEDTRTTKAFLNEFGISVDLISYHDHNERARAPQIIKRLQEGDRIALVSEAGMPLISDPGFHIVSLAIENEVEVCPVPGPDAITTALSVCGIPPLDFRFIGFLPRKSSARKILFQELSSESYAWIFYESPHRILETLKDIESVMPNRHLAVCKDLTKHTEHVYRGVAEQIFSQFESEDKVRGELTVVVSGNKSDGADPENSWGEIDSVRLIEALAKEGCSTKLLAAAIAQVSNIKRKKAFAEILKIKEQDDE